MGEVVILLLVGVLCEHGVVWVRHVGRDRTQNVGY